ncbi:hypothetical protein SCHIN_v1c02240 [Spiroplasma chinense]|uniref:Lipoprotein n=1 Tax=Spiroplasma chinense TaxID=216932 RepID=A0A5B9Y374_9MOLU|nr:lipoprotein [Spiroplasma chinense]QEH61421.1 hypothetical protein SCHIN_v1c02240 [Spiroplasma chinense]
MKKLLSFLGAFGLIASTSTSVVSCFGEEDTSYITVDVDNSNLSLDEMKTKLLSTQKDYKVLARVVEAEKYSREEYNKYVLIVVVIQDLILRILNNDVPTYEIDLLGVFEDTASKAVELLKPSIEDESRELLEDSTIKVVEDFLNYYSK